MAERVKPEKIMEELMNYLLASGKLRVKIIPNQKIFKGRFGGYYKEIMGVSKVYAIKKKKIDTP